VANLIKFFNDIAWTSGI